MHPCSPDYPNVVDAFAAPSGGGAVAGEAGVAPPAPAAEAAVGSGGWRDCVFGVQGLCLSFQRLCVFNVCSVCFSVYVNILSVQCIFTYTQLFECVCMCVCSLYQSM